MVEAVHDKFTGHSLGVVVGDRDLLGIVAAVDTDQPVVAHVEGLAVGGDKVQGLRAGQVADGRAKPEEGLGHLGSKRADKGQALVICTPQARGLDVGEAAEGLERLCKKLEEKVGGGLVKKCTKHKVYYANQCFATRETHGPTFFFANKVVRKEP